MKSEHDSECDVRSGNRNRKEPTGEAGKTEQWRLAQARLLNPGKWRSALSAFVLLFAVPLSAEAINWIDGLTIFGMARIRPEFHANSDFNRRTEDTREFVGSIAQLGLEKNLSEDTSIVLRIQDSRVWGGNPGSDNGFGTANDFTEDSLDMREAYIQSENLLGPLGIRFGRQMLAYGSERQIGKVGWSNVGRSFDALEMHMEWGIWKTSMAGAVLAEEDSDGGGNGTQVGRSNPSGLTFSCDPTTKLCTVQASTARELDDAYLAVFYNEFRIHPQFQLEPYYIGVYKKWIPASVSPYPGIPVPPRARDRQRDNLHTVGLRITNKTVRGKSAHPMFDYSLEGAIQTGFNGERVQAGWDWLNQVDANGDPVYTEKQSYEAYAIYADLGFKPLESFRIGLVAELASGDANRNDARINTYTQLYPTNHGPMGDMDLVGSRNLIARALTLGLDLGKAGNMKIAYWHFKKHRAQDSYYSNGGAVARDGDGELMSTETSSNSRYSTVLDANGKISENSVAQLSSQLFHEYNITYSISVNQLKLDIGYGQAYALSSIRHRVDETFNQPDLRDPAFDPRSDFAYLMVTAKF